MFKPYSHIYVEEKILDHFRTKEILSKFKSATVIPISHYKDVFNKRGQNFRAQKLSPKLILAEKKENYLYPGSNFSPSFDHPHFYYNTLALNCIYDCDYCYLQGMFPSANLVFFVNWEDFFSATDEFLEKNKSLYLALSYDTDLLATESFYPASRAWIRFAETRPDLLLELRTKSGNYASIQDIKPIPNLILAWTVSPDSIAKQVEKKAPGTKGRLDSAARAIRDGWKVRICLDPVLLEPDWKTSYRTLFEEMREQIDKDMLVDISIGSFRMNSDFLKTIQQTRKDSALLYYPFHRKDGVVSYPEKENEEMLDFIRNLFSSWIPSEKIKCN
ncbi:SPL family radical SAM protein [Leptospira idonii]|uniref:DNA photolyase n=1 Tax=Leptospira idonii TaxID=1193500 RepID=A0A4R9LZN2_9LEPT|nr:DNA photolyase [Leptospira idonii]TGN18955.1 DNA photolyase [Leptospira idonii]